MQEDVLREHKNFVDGLRSDFEALNASIPASSTADVTSLTGNEHFDR